MTEQRTEKNKNSLEAICTLAAGYDKRRRALLDLLEQVEEERKAVLGPYLPALARENRALGQAKRRLHEAIAANPQLFEKPKTITAHGVKFGFRKQKGSLVIADNAVTVRRIKALLPEKLEALICVSERPVKKALEGLDGKTLKALGVSLGDTTDVVTISSPDGNLEKLIQQLLEAEEKAGEAA